MSSHVYNAKEKCWHTAILAICLLFKGTGVTAVLHQAFGIVYISYGKGGKK